MESSIQTVTKLCSCLRIWRQDESARSKQDDAEPNVVTTDDLYPGLPLPLENDSLNLEHDVERFAIRTVLLLPGLASGNDEIQCILQNTTIRESKAKYRALSYHWGDDSRRHAIRLNGKRFEVRENLWQALRHLRHERERRIFWIDLLCINQSKVQEKNSQVRYMWAIYQHASETTVFLGEDTKFTEPSMTWVERVAEAILAERSSGKRLNPPWYTNDLLSLADAVGELMKLPWWRRVWVAQEVAVAQTVTVMWGTKTLPWDYFDLLIDAYVSWSLGRRAYIPFFNTAPFRWDAASAIQTARSHFQRSQHVRGLATLLIRFRGLKSTDPRDKVYGILRLSREWKSIAPDYTVDEAEVFKETVRLSITQSRTLAILSAVNYLDRSLLLPSWCPNWSGSAPDSRPLFSPEFRSAGESEATARFSDEVLTLRGIRVDTIAQLHIFPSDDKILERGEREALRALVRSRNIQNSPYETEKAREDKLKSILYLNTFNRFAQELKILQQQWYEQGTSEETGEETVEQAYVEYYIQRVLEDPTITYFRAYLNGTNDNLPLHNAKGRNLFVSEKGYLGLVPTAVREGDVLVVFLGGRMLFCIRPVKGEENFELIGDCYMDGYMSGEAMDQVAAGELSEQDFDLV